jgi:hypothetical protein
MIQEAISEDRAIFLLIQESSCFKHGLLHNCVRKVSRQHPSYNKMVHQHIVLSDLCRRQIQWMVDWTCSWHVVASSEPRINMWQFALGHCEKENFSTPPNNSWRITTSNRQHGSYPDEHGEKLKFVRRMEGRIYITSILLLLWFFVGCDWIHLVLPPLLAYCTSPGW